MLVRDDVIVDVHPGLMPGRELIPGGGQRPQRRPVDLPGQQLAAAVELLERPGVDLGHAGGDRGVRLGQGTELPVAEAGDDPPLGDQHPRLGLGLIPGLIGPGRDDGHAVVGGHLGERGVDVGLVPVRPGHARAKVAADHDLRAAGQRLEAVHVRGDPVQQLLGRERLGIQVIRRAHDRDEQLGAQRDLTGAPVPDRDRLAGEVHEQLLPGLMRLAHGHVDGAAPLPVQAGELAVTVTVRAGLPVLHPQQLQRHALAPQLLVHPGPIRNRPRHHRRSRRRIQQHLQPGIIKPAGQRPLQAGRRGPAQVVADRGQRHAGRGADLPAAQLLTQSQPQNFADLAHVDTGSRHRRHSSDSGQMSEAAFQRPQRPPRYDTPTPAR
jgi:hypothetical protein